MFDGMPLLSQEDSLLLLLLHSIRFEFMFSHLDHDCPFLGEKNYIVSMFLCKDFEIHTLLSSMRKSKVLKFKILFDIEFFSSNQDFLIRKIKEPELNFNIIHCVCWIRRARAPLLQPLSQTWVGARQ